LRPLLPNLANPLTAKPLLAKRRAVHINGFLFTVQEKLSTMMQKIRWAILILGILVLLTAMVQNSQPVPLKLFLFETAMPTSIVLLVTSATSFLIGAITAGRMLRRRDAGRNQASPPT